MPQRKAGFKKPKKAGAMGLHQETDKPSICVANFQCVGASHSKTVMLKAGGMGVGVGQKKSTKGACLRASDPAL